MGKSGDQKSWRVLLVCLVMGLALLALCWRLIDLSVVKRAFLVRQSQARTLRSLTTPAHRGMILDRFDSPLAVSTPTQSVWMNPQLFNPSAAQLQALAKILRLSVYHIKNLKDHSKREFIYLKRALLPAVAQEAAALKIPGIFFQREYRRYYPEGEVTAHVVGFTNIDDAGQEGIELEYDQWLRGISGKKQVLKDRLGNVIAQLGLAQKPREGRNVELSLDHRIQYLAYQKLKDAVQTYHAESGSAVVLDVETGEILAMVNQPSYDPNDRHHAEDSRYRNRAVTDIFEPGSVIKPFSIAFALESGKYSPSTTIDTRPGWIKVGGYRIHDDLNYGVVTLTELLQKSSTVAAAKVLLSLDPQHYWQLLRFMGFGEVSDSAFPGEAAGKIAPQTTWVPSVVATLSYGYGISVTALQLAAAYATLAAGGIKRPVTLLRVDRPLTDGQRVLPENIAKTVVKMLETVVQSGTGTRANVPGYLVAGKTGTAYIAGAHGYDHHRYMSSFVGMAPADHPKLVIAVVIKNPQGKHFGGIVAAPVFAQIMQGAVRLLGIAPDYHH